MLLRCDNYESGKRNFAADAWEVVWQVPGKRELLVARDFNPVTGRRKIGLLTNIGTRWAVAVEEVPSERFKELADWKDTYR